jgi:SAM-dependent methyltransferase
MRTRYDKTESVIRNRSNYGNSLYIATRIWRSIINPVTEDDIAGLGNPDVYPKVMESMQQINNNNAILDKSYYQKRSSDAAGMRAFHNWIKTSMISSYCKEGNTVLDVGCGRGGDLMKFICANISEYVGLDISNNDLYVIPDSANNRYQKYRKSMKNVPPMTFINADAKGIFDVGSQLSIFPNMFEKNKEAINEHLSGNKKYNVINCQFTMHYYLSDKTGWHNFLKNINDHLANNGYLLITCFDGDFLHKKLEGKDRMTISQIDRYGKSSNLVDIVKEYKDTDAKDVGMTIKVYNSLYSNEGVYNSEYLVPQDVIVRDFKEHCGIKLVETDNFYNLFNLYRPYFQGRDNVADVPKFKVISNFYHMVDCPDNFAADVSDAARASFKLSMLNKYYIFKKTTGVDVSKPSRIGGVNYKINIGHLLTPQFAMDNIYIDPARQTSDINKLYHGILKSHLTAKPSVYLMKHLIHKELVGHDNYYNDEFRFYGLKEGDGKKLMIIYKSPENLFYPLCIRGTSKNQYLFNSKRYVDDMESLVKLTY